MKPFNLSEVFARGPHSRAQLAVFYRLDRSYRPGRGSARRKALKRCQKRAEALLARELAERRRFPDHDGDSSYCWAVGL